MDNDIVNWTNDLAQKQTQVIQIIFLLDRVKISHPTCLALSRMSFSCFKMVTG